jgi:hypothetical protein
MTHTEVQLSESSRTLDVIAYNRFLARENLPAAVIAVRRINHWPQHIAGTNLP